MATKNRPSPRSEMTAPNSFKWSDDFYLRAYLLAKDGLNDKEVAEVLGVTKSCLHKWCVVRPALANALAEAREPSDGPEEPGWVDYVYQKLPPKLREVWDELRSIQNEKNAIVKVEALLRDAGLKARQHLFVHALAMNNFNYSRACKMLNISRRTIEKWVKTEPEFGELLDEMDWHQKNFYENSLLRLVKKGDTHATIFANKTRNKDRGYNEKVTVEHSGEVNVNVTHTLQIKDLNLPLDVRRSLLVAVRDRQKVIDAEEVARLESN